MDEITNFDIGDRMGVVVEEIKRKVGILHAEMGMVEEPTGGDVKRWAMGITAIFMEGIEHQANWVSDAYGEVDKLRNEVRGKERIIEELKEEMKDQATAVKAVAKAKDKVEEKASSKEMEDKLRVSITQFKLMDIDIGKETEDRKEIIEKGIEGVKKRLRTDYQEEFAKLVKDAEVAPLTRKTTKPNGKEYYTAPLLVTVHDRNKKWRMEEMLRNSKVFPSFHWPHEMVGIIKDYKKVLKDNGVDEDSTYIRIRPTERDGRMRIKADTRAKEGNGKFTLKASWEAPPLCPEVRGRAKDHLKPVWAGQRG